MSELLNCPFCGAKPEIEGEYERQGRFRSRWKIVCPHCPAEMDSMIEGVDAAGRNMQLARLSGYWNRREASHATE